MLTFVSKVTMINSDGSVFGLYNKLTNSFSTDPWTAPKPFFQQNCTALCYIKNYFNDC